VLTATLSIMMLITMTLSKLTLSITRQNTWISCDTQHDGPNHNDTQHNLTHHYNIQNTVNCNTQINKPKWHSAYQCNIIGLISTLSITTLTALTLSIRTLSMMCHIKLSKTIFHKKPET
jgi:hypothetical protein